MKKKILALCLTTVVALGAFVGCSSKTATPQETKEEVAKEEMAQEEGIGYESLVIGLDDTFAPMGFRDANGELVGVDVDLMKAVAEKLGVEIELQPIDWAMKETELSNKNIDVIWNGYTITEARKQTVSFTKPYLNNRQVVMVMADTEINTLADLKGKTVAAQAESSAVEAINSKPEVSGIFKELVTFETNDQCIMDLETGRTDAIVADEIILRYYISQKDPSAYKILEEDFGDEEYGIGVRQEDTALVDGINNALDQLKAEGVTAEISQKWFSEDIILP
ncbi:MAG: transporter substrate-binding domain-containing protein [Anaerotignaceae bacterium]